MVCFPIKKEGGEIPASDVRGFCPRHLYVPPPYAQYAVAGVAIVHPKHIKLPQKVNFFKPHQKFFKRKRTIHGVLWIAPIFFDRLRRN
ncbi:MAG: hypothetical protein AAB727_02815, partial [Patescibacteria group bacterium]